MSTKTGVLVGGPDDGRTFPEFTSYESFGFRTARWRDGDTYYFAAESGDTAFYLHTDVDRDTWQASRNAPC